MSNNLIQWPRAQFWDKPWNPIVGCKHVSPACDNCYARCATVDRFGQSFEPHRTKKVCPPSSGVVFAGNMTDLFGDWLRTIDSSSFIAQTLGHSETATYIWCTKRTENMCDCLIRERVLIKGDYDCDYSFRDCEMSNQYFGFTAEDQQRYAERLLPIYRAKEKWMQFWVSAEPLLGPLRLGLDGDLIPGTFKWLVVGCESGPRRRPCKLEWVESIVDQCRAANVPVFVKQLDIDGKCERDITKFPPHLRIRQVPWAVRPAS